MFFVILELIYERMRFWDSGCELDSDIYQRLVGMCYQYLGWWKKWFFYYGIIEVLEINVSLDILCEWKDLIQGIQF